MIPQYKNYNSRIQAVIQKKHFPHVMLLLLLSKKIKNRQIRLFIIGMLNSPLLKQAVLNYKIAILKLFIQFHIHKIKFKNIWLLAMKFFLLVKNK